MSSQVDWDVDLTVSSSHKKASESLMFLSSCV